MTKFKKTIKARKERLEKILGLLKKEHTDARIALEFGNPLELLVATILSAQCTDERVNKVTKDLFKKYKTANDYVEIPQEQLEEDIYSTGFYRNKAKNIKGACKSIVEEYDGNVPGTMKELLKLDGVGRKTANVVLGHCFDTPGIVVDTHVKRLSNRLGLVNQKDPVKIEFELMKLMDEDEWVMFTHYMIQHGRKICKSRKPNCDECNIGHLCPSKEKYIDK